MMTCSPLSQTRAISSAMALSQGQRSSSVRGWPARIFSTLLAGRKLSPSSNRQPRRSPSAFARVLLPEPDTPITINAQGASTPATNFLRKRGLVDQPDGLAIRARAYGRQSLAIEQARQDRLLVWPPHPEQHFAAGRHRGGGEREPPHQRGHSGRGAAAPPP